MVRLPELPLLESQLLGYSIHSSWRGARCQHDLSQSLGCGHGGCGPLLLLAAACGAWHLWCYLRLAKLARWRVCADGPKAESDTESWVITGAAVSCLGQQLSEMAEAAFQLQGMAEDGWLPTCFAHRSRFDTPSLPLAVITVLVLVLSVFSSFNAIINMLNSVYCVAQVIEFSAFLHLRRKHDDLERPFRVPCRSLAACCLLLLMPFAFCLVLLVMPFVRGDWFQVASLLGSILLGLLLYHLLELSRRRGWLTFYRCPPGGLEDILAQRPNESLWDDANDTQALPLSWRAELSQSLGRL
ncbi:Probable polyamine transporter At3g19553 [Durusdinium trenchii]|uniref:Probable polyamine transporter At3g19553 n=1 Tax=Durusdinium trenchii TaxID=1381693 RepID=A0ABP0QY04_9DINO